MPYLQTGDLPYQHDQDEPGAGTSREGARNVAPVAMDLRERYYRWLRSRGLIGATDLEAAAEFGCERTTIIPRRAELKTAVAFSGVKRGRMVRGKLCASKVWIAKERA